MSARRSCRSRSLFCVVGVVAALARLRAFVSLPSLDAASTGGGLVATRRVWPARRSRNSHCTPRRAELQPWEFGYKTPPRTQYLDDFDDAAIERFYQETISGNGGRIHPGRLQTMVDQQFDFQMGEDKHKEAFVIMQEQLRAQTWRTYGGPKSETLDDGKGWVWLATEMTCAGPALQILTSIPYGRRPLLVAKADDVDSMFEKVNWVKVEERLDVELGTPVPGGTQPDETSQAPEAAATAPKAAATAPEAAATAPKAAATAPQAATPAPEASVPEPAPVVEPEVAFDPEAAKEAARALRVRDLREKLRSLGADDAGTKEDLVERLVGIQGSSRVS